MTIKRNGLKGKLSISQPSYGDGTKAIEITLVDDVAASECVTIRVGLEEFAEALTGLSRVECTFDFRPDVVGKKYEHKRERVKYSGGYERADARSNPKVLKALAPFEVDGWIGTVDDLFNHHRHLSDGTFNVSFHRYVDIDEDAGQ